MPYFMFQWTYTDTAVQAMLNKPQDAPGNCARPSRPSAARCTSFFTVGASMAWPSSNSPTTRAAPPAG